MNILVLHRIPYYKIDYHLGIDHCKHRVIYIGTHEALSNVPDDQKFEKVVRKGEQSLMTEVSDYIRYSNIKFDHIISMSEYELLDAANLRAFFDISGPKPEQVSLVRNKLLMKKALESQVKVPKFLSLSNIFNVGAFSEDTKVIIKPIDGASSENIVTCRDIKDAIFRINNKTTGIFDLDVGNKSLCDYEIEEYVDGDILHIDGIVENGKIIVCIASQYIGNCLSYAHGQPLASIQVDTTEYIWSWAQKCISGTQITSGSFHLEAINSTTGLVFLEIANRVGGADVVKTFELATGIHLPSAELKLLFGDKIIIDPSKFDRSKYGWFVYPGHHLISGYVSILNSRQFEKNQIILKWNKLNKSVRCKKTITYQANEVPISGLLKANSFEELKTFVSKMFATIRVVDDECILGDVA